MPNAVFSSPDFWELYFTLESGTLTLDDAEEQLDELSDEFPVYETPYEIVHRGQKTTGISNYVEFWFSCGDRYSLMIEYEPDPEGSDLQLFLRDSQTDAKHQMGWWDLAGWHPYCLRLQELDRLLEYWVRFDDRWPSPELPLLLLSQFVGLSNEQEQKSLVQRANAALASLGVPTQGKNGFEAPLEIPEANYRWSEDPEFGWVFSSQEYNCYSLRNRDHAGSTEGNFPFAEFREMMKDIEQRLTAK